MGDATRKLIGIVGHDDESDGRVGTVVFYDACGHDAVGFVETMEGFVEDEQVRGFYEGSSQETKTLLATADAEKGAVRQMLDAEASHPRKTGLALLGAGSDVEPYTVVEPTGNNIYGRKVAHVGTIHFGADITDVLLDVPDALTRAAAASEQFDIAGIGLGIVGAYEAEECALAGTIGTLQRPMFATMHRPREVAENGALAIADGDLGKTEEGRRRRRRCAGRRYAAWHGR